MNIIVTANYEVLSETAANRIAEVIKNKPNAVLGLATGSTPIGLYKKLVTYNKENLIDFSRVTTFNLDEYIGIPASHTQSYRYFMDYHLFNHINIDYQKTHVPNGMAKDIQAECEAYDEMLRGHGGIDIQVLGIGNNGHIGFNEPGSALTVGTHVTELAQGTIEANSRFFSTREEVPTQAITMGIGDIMKAREVILLASGITKADIISRLLEDKIDTYIPASLLQAHPHVTVIVDQLAGQLI
ncbi:glucosamine-6-phosphate deaminase [Cellulosilyticum sp. I15G10I2]|uniref:glucosamine-6-phosphate deaminase n=1 Tax=Cellulosilyticum sp. I15G10I2 TaxID=1892843 RepID=UPI00085BD308|nr:glucosamine-6-phosphate deaminase [Cellulosilyticum sp. I15G10I2]